MRELNFQFDINVEGYTHNKYSINRMTRRQKKTICRSDIDYKQIA